MHFQSAKAQFIDEDKLPDPVKESVVRSLYADQKSLAVGTVTMTIAPIVLFIRTNDPTQLFFAIALFIFGVLRLIDGSLFRRVATKTFSPAEVATWENRYATLGSLYVTGLGMWCLVGFARTSDVYVHQLSVIVTMAYLTGIMGRKFSSKKVVLYQTLLASSLLVSGLFVFGSGYDAVLALFVIPMFASFWLMSRNLRLVLFNAVLTSIDNKTIADRFDIALSNVSHGLALLDRKGEFVVANSQFMPLVGLHQGTELVGNRICDLPPLMTTLENGVEFARKLQDVFADCLANGRQQRFRHVLSDGSIIESTYNPTSDGGGVFVLEDISERVGSEEEIRKLASFDPLTHLPNRRYFAIEINRLLLGDNGLEPCTLFFVDLDNFKDVNDTLGHTIGDKLLCAVALRMRSRMPENGMVCRFGGDEFVIVVPGKMRRKDISAFAELMIAELSKSMVIDGHLLAVGASIGIAQSPGNGRDYNHLLKVADMALYDAKARGRGCHSFYSDELGDVIRDRRALENDLRRSIDRGELQLHFQPLVDIHQNRINTCEALLRWNHPERGSISPAVFIPVAEEIGMISQIGKFVLEQATSVCKSWPESVSVAVNVSSLQFQQSDVCAVVKAALAKSGLDPRRLEVEVTESAMLGNVQETTAILTRLAKSGVSVSLDDFGTGFSSLSYLHQLPLNKVKIDRSFIEKIDTDERSLVLLSGVTHLANELGLSITIEGVETAEQMHILCEKVHVDEMQGYLFGRAMPACDIGELLQAQESGKSSDQPLRHAVG